jgi:hypothetical protein
MLQLNDNETVYTVMNDDKNTSDDSDDDGALKKRGESDYNKCVSLTEEWSQKVSLVRNIISSDPSMLFLTGMSNPSPSTPRWIFFAT